MHVIGLSGRKGHGKDTFAKILIDSDKRYIRASFADHLRTICSVVFGIRRPQLVDPSLKEAQLPVPIEIDKSLDRLREETKLPDIQARGLIATTPRQLLQYVGTDYIRVAYPTFWVDHVVELIKANPEQRYIVTDVRFGNEADRIRELGGQVVRLVRVARSEDPVIEHSSEKLDFPVDYTLAVMERNWTLPTLVAKSSISDRLDDFLHAYDWDHLRLALVKESLSKASFPTFVAQVYYGEYLTAQTVDKAATLVAS